MSQLLNNVSTNIKLHNMSTKTETAYIWCIKEYIFFHQKKHPKELNEEHIQSFLTHLAVNKNYAPSTQSQALNAIVFLYREVLDLEIGDFSSFKKAKPKTHIPVVFSKAEAKTIISKMQDTPRLIASILYGSGLHLFFSGKNFTFYKLALFGMLIVNVNDSLFIVRLAVNRMN
jgi:site-specific recombinase XerD